MRGLLDAFIRYLPSAGEEPPVTAKDPKSGSETKVAPDPNGPLLVRVFKTAADPQSPLNPFSQESEATRRASVELFAEVARGSKTKIPSDLGAELPMLLWLYHMGIMLFWIHDDSSGQKRTRRLMEHTVEIVVRLIQLASLPPMRPLRKSVLNMLADLRESGAIEQDADVVIFIYREDVYDQNSERKGIADIIVSKHRNGPIGKKELFFQDRFAKFESLDLREA